MKDKTIDNYLKIAKYNLVLNFILCLIIILILLFIGIKYSIIFCFFLLILPVFIIIAKIIVYKNINKIKKYLIKTNIDIGKILYWNNSNYFFTDNYIIIKDEKHIRCFTYKDIIEIEKETSYDKKNISEYLYIKLKDYSVYKIDIKSRALVDETYYDISEFLISKNKKIKYDNRIKNAIL